MLAVEPVLDESRPPDVLCVGAHCDDIEIGCGALLLLLQTKYPSCRIHWAILSSDPERRLEATHAMRAFVRPACRGDLTIGNLPDGRLPAHFSDAKTFLTQVRDAVSPDLVLTPHEEDRHQDHRTASEITWQTFRDHLILQYEIPKYDGGLGTPNVYVPFGRRMASRKAELLARLYRSQRSKDWFSEETFLALMKLRGIECRSDGGYAEAFHCSKSVLSLAPASRPRKRR